MRQTGGLIDGSVHPDILWGVLQAARIEVGPAAEHFFAGIDFSARVPMEQALGVWHALAALDEDSTLGARLGRHQLAHGGAISILLNGAGAQTTVARAMRVLSRYWALISSHAELIVEYVDDSGDREYRLRSVYGAGSRPIVVSTSTLYVLLDGLRDITGGATPLLRVHVAAPLSARGCGRLTSLFGAPVFGGSGFDCLVFGGAFAEQALPEKSRGARAFDRATAESLLPKDTGSTLREEVIKEIQVRLPAAPHIDDVAAAMATTPRSLQRRLRHDGTTFRQLCLHTRVDIARGFLRVGGTVSEVAFLLGYADATAFSRMYRKVTGHPPQDDAQQR